MITGISLIMSVGAAASAIVAWQGDHASVAMFNAVSCGLWLTVGIRSFNGVRR